MGIQHETPQASKRTPHRALGIAVAVLSLMGLAILLVLFSSVTPAIALPVLVALAGVNVFSAWQLLRKSKSDTQPRYVMTEGRIYPIFVAIVGFGGAIFAIVYTVQTSDATMIGIYLVIFATALRALYEKPRS